MLQCTPIDKGNDKGKKSDSELKTEEPVYPLVFKVVLEKYIIARWHLSAYVREHFIMTVAVL
jgi:hypothetical protein